MITSAAWPSIDVESSNFIFRSSAKPIIEVKAIWRGIGPREIGNGQRVTGSTDDFGTIEIIVETRDDRSEPHQIGFLFEVVDGVIPKNFIVPTEPRRALGCGNKGGTDECIYALGWNDGAQDLQERFDFTICAVALDRAGNISAVSDTIQVFDPGRVE